MSYLDSPPTTYNDATIPSVNVDNGVFSSGVFTSSGASSDSSSISGTIQLYSSISYNDGVETYNGAVQAVGPNSFVMSVFVPELSFGSFSYYLEVTDPSYGSGVGTYDYTPYEYNSSITCFAQGTRIATARGARPVETLRPGDTVRTASGQLRPVVWCGSRRIDCRWHPNPQAALPVCIEPNAFGPGLPRHPLFLSPDHAVFAAGILVPIRYLLNGSTVRQVDVPEVTYHHIELETHDVVLADGLPCETFLDTGNRATLIGNDPAGPSLPGIPDQTYMLWDALGAAPLLTGGPQVDRIRADLAARVHKAINASPRRRLRA